MIRRYKVKNYKEFCIRMKELEICAIEQGFEDKDWSIVFKRPVISLKRYIELREILYDEIENENRIN